MVKMQKMIFVTGGTGLVGMHLLFELAGSGKRIRALKRKSSDLNQVQKIFSYYAENAADLFGRIEWVDGDILDYFSMEEVLKDVDEIYHCAAVVSFDGKDRQRMISSNVEGTANLVNAAIENGVKKMCHVSSVSALGKRQNGEFVNESTNWIPTKKHSAYSESKFFSEAEIWRGIEEGLDAVIVNPSVIIGPGNWENSSARYFKTIWDGMKYYTKGVTGYVSVQDVVRAMVTLMEPENFKDCKNERYLLSAENLSFQNVFNQIADALGKPRPTVYATDFMTGIAWRAAKLAGWITGQPPVITREIASGRNEINNFDGSKITRTIEFQYEPVSEAIKKTAACLLREMQ